MYLELDRGPATEGLLLAVLRDVWANETVYVPEPFELGTQQAPPLPHPRATQPPPDTGFGRS
jgi:hypothetical protein